jgi:hypothetical protein
MTATKKISARTLLAGMGFTHRPGTGYKPELNPYQSYINPALPRLADVCKQLEAAGYYQTRATFRVVGERYAACFERNVPYASDRLDLDSPDGIRCGRITAYYGRSIF